MLREATGVTQKNAGAFWVRKRDVNAWTQQDNSFTRAKIYLRDCVIVVKTIQGKTQK